MSEENNSKSSACAMALSTDAIPLSPRQSHERSEMKVIPGQNDHTYEERTLTETEQRPKELFESMPEPPADWQFNILLRKLGDSIPAEDLSKMKSLFEGEGGIGKGVQEKMKSPSDFFRILRARGYISRDNLLHLQAILFWAGRKDLIQDAVEYSKTIGNVLHFYASSYEPENGYRYVKFHIDGKDFTNYSRKDLELLRKKVATLLFVPEQFIIIKGIEPASSLVITLMIPDIYVEILKELLDEGSLDDFVDLKGSGVDFVVIDGKAVYNIRGTNKDILVEAEQQTKLLNVYDQLQQAKERLDNSEMECIDLSQQTEYLQSKIDKTEESLHKVENELHALKIVFSREKDEAQPASLKELSSLKEFTDALHQINSETVDKKVVQRMIDSTVNIVSTRMRERHRISERSVLLHLQDMQSQLAPLQFELERYKCFTVLSNMDKYVLDRLLLQPFIAQAQAQISLTPYGLQMLETISSKLCKTDKEKLRRKYQWTPGGKIEQFMEQGQDRFLAGLYYKEVETKRVDVHCETFIAQCLSEIGREDLKKFLEPGSIFPNPPSPRYFTENKQKTDFPQGQNSQQEQQQQQQQQQKRPYSSTQKQEQSQGQQQLHNQSPIITRMAQQIQEMYNILQMKQSVSTSKFDDWKTPSFPFQPQAFPY
ncbi:putative uncharacterized protein DDB_G0268364 [Mercenaria mercenaria]|uniref:putative uncharacterized protein DDB_G0268364 n=1 Tax=Mercenaria mercenaria TaxID=6596 RepID=UPI00234F5429|nr:putative uncharacterized protein DDB_G0268364 [Mercenaria mercenaria]XP_053397923.1 putative uncharacterized protein DDB_G0268364 [Mercenaria mercenaria]